MARGGYESDERERRRHHRRRRSDSFDSTKRYSPKRDRDSSRSRRHNSHQQRRRSRDSERRRRSYSRSRSPQRKRPRSSSPGPRHRGRRHPDENSRKRSGSRDGRRSDKPLPSQQDAFNDQGAVVRKSPAPEKEKPNFGNTGRLAAASNTITTADGQAIILKYHEPPEARKPAAKDAWRMYVFKDTDVLDTVELGHRSCWLFGREHAVTDFPIDHPSCSKQHAAIQFRYVEKKNEFGDRTGKVMPFMIDLESANGTIVNGEVLPAGRYFELRDKDVVKFGLSSREYVIMLPPPS